MKENTTYPFNTSATNLTVPNLDTPLLDWSKLLKLLLELCSRHIEGQISNVNGMAFNCKLNIIDKQLLVLKELQDHLSSHITRDIQKIIFVNIKYTQTFKIPSSGMFSFSGASALEGAEASGVAGAPEIGGCFSVFLGVTFVVLEGK